MERRIKTVGRRAALLCVALALGCGAEVSPDGQTEEIVHGRRDNADEAVLALRSVSGVLCTASLLAPRVVLTARHCVSELASESVDCASRGRQVLRDHAASEFVVIAGTDALRGTPVARGQQLVVPASSRLCDADIALLVLDREVPGLTPLQPELREGPARGDTIVAVGFGQRGDGLSAGVRYRRAGVPVVGHTEQEFTVRESVCSGDSGGPALDARTGRVVGVVSRGGPQCDGPEVQNIYTRVDAWAALVQQALTLGARAR